MGLTLLETLTGTGQLLKDQTLVGSIRYHIQTYQNWISTTSFEGSSEVPGLKSYQMSGAPNTLLDLGETYTLTLTDGRQCKVAIKQMSLSGQNCDFMVVDAGNLS